MRRMGNVAKKCMVNSKLVGKYSSPMDPMGNSTNTGNSIPPVELCDRWSPVVCCCKFLPVFSVFFSVFPVVLPFQSSPRLLTEKRDPQVV